VWIRRTILSGLLCCLAAAGAGSRRASAASVLNELATQAQVAPSLCRVVVQNAWGVPLAFAYGFVLGNGQFVVTELGALVQPGTARAVIRFQDGSEVVADQFGMADPVSGLAALHLKGGVSARKGLTVVRTAPPPGCNAKVARMGWEQGHELRLATGRLIAGPRMVELALRTGTSLPRADWAFLRIVGHDVASLAGTPVLDAGGTVLGVRVHVMSRGAPVPLVVPATALWNALFSSKRELKPLTLLPQTAWGVPVLRLEGEPVTVPQFGRIAQTAKDSMVCRTCKGRGRSLSVDSGVITSYYTTCHACRGEGIACVAGVYDNLAEMALACTRVAWAEGLEARDRRAILAAGIERLKQLAAAGPRFRAAWGRAVAVDMIGMEEVFCRGIVIAARVSKTVEGPEGRYTFLETGRFSAPVAFRATAVDKPTTPGPVGSPAEPKVGTWIVLAGAALARFSTQGAPDPAKPGAAEAVSPKADPTEPASPEAGPSESASPKPGAGRRASRKGPAAELFLPKPRPSRPVYVLPFGWIPTRPAAPVRPLPREDLPGRLPSPGGPR